MHRARVGVLFVEIICSDPAIIDANVRKNKLNLPDYDGMSADEALEDFRARIRHYARSYRTVEDDEGSYVKVIDSGRKVISSGIEGYVSPGWLCFSPKPARKAGGTRRPASESRLQP